MLTPYSHITKVFQSFEPRILFAYIFGSTGTDSESSGSDLDIAVYFDMPAAAVELDHKLFLYAAVSRAMKRNDIDIVALNTCTNQMLLYEIMTQGRLLFEDDFEARALFEQQTLHKAIDFKQQRERIFG